MKIVSVVGARPQFVKLAPLSAAFNQVPGVTHVIVHTGQHYDPNMSDIFFEGLDIPAPHRHLGVGSGAHGAQTGAMLAALEVVLLEERPDWTLVYGDTNSTLAAALAATKLHLPVAHLEAGLRSFNRSMPEEINRVLTDHAADYLLAPTRLAMENLAREGLASRSKRVGDVMTDVCLETRRRLDQKRETLAPSKPNSEPYVLATIHRAENTDDPERLRAIVATLQSLDTMVILAAHPRLRERARVCGLRLDGGSLRIIQPQGYVEMATMVSDSNGVITDSGGLQKEAFLLQKPCTTLRQETEWPETLLGGWNILDFALTRVRQLASRPVPSVEQGLPFGDGKAAQRVVECLTDAR